MALGMMAWIGLVLEMAAQVPPFKMVANDPAEGYQFGYSVSVSGDTAVVGAYGDDHAGVYSGSVYVFTRSGFTWTQQAKLTAADAAMADWFGMSVSVSGDTIVVGAAGDDESGRSESGSAYVFTRSGSTWTQQAKLIASDATTGDMFGYSVSVSGDTVVVGTEGDDDGGNNSGSAYVFTLSGANWTQQAKLTAGDADAEDWFGHSVSVSGDMIVAGACNDEAGGSNSGSAYVFTRNGSIWTQQAKLLAADAAVLDWFGWSVAVSVDTIVVGAKTATGRDKSGSAYVFTRNGSTWTQQAKVTAASPAANDQFGCSVSVADNTVLVGSYGDGTGGSQSGSAYVFTRSGSTWTQLAKLIAADAAESDQFGWSVSISDNTLLVGAYGDDDGGSSSGSAYAFDFNSVSITNGPVWTWTKGNPRTYGYYGELGVPHADNVPGARYGSTAWTASDGTLWLFGGSGYDGEGSRGALNDLWKYDPLTGNWTWMKGASTIGQAGVYGEIGLSHPNNTPGARAGAAGWKDGEGSLWLYSGDGVVSDDLWKYTPATGNWTWMKGASSGSTPATYGTLGVPGATNTPGRRRAAVSWRDSAGNLWLFGGEAQFGTGGDYNDLWKYTPATGNWTWMKGATARDANGTYGTLGVSAATNTPGARRLAAAWSALDGKLWLFGGGGFAKTGGFSHLNDLWSFDPLTGNWTWVKGASLGNQPGTYGEFASPAEANTPGGRYGAVAWVDNRGVLWLFGGLGYDGDGNNGWLNDLWRFDLANADWTWMRGATTGWQTGVYGTQGSPDPAACPGSRTYSVGWAGSAGTLWLFGGTGYDDTATLDYLGDLWSLTNIHDSCGIVLSEPLWLGGGQFRFTITSQPGAVLQVWRSTDLSAWTLLDTLTNASGTTTFTDLQAVAPAGFYRVKRQ